MNYFLALTVAPLAILSGGVALHADQSSSSQGTTQEPYYPSYYGSNTGVFFLYGEFIYWKPFTQDPLNWVRKIELSLDGNGNTLNNETDIRTMNFDYSAAFRVGGGYRFAQNAWDHYIRPWQFEFEYTRLRTGESQSAKAQGIATPTQFNALEAMLPVFGFNGVLNKAHSRISLDYDRLDLKFAWPIWIRHNVILRLMGGATFAWFNNDWKSRYSTVPVNGLINTNRTNLKWHWWGGGLFGGGDIYLSIGHGFGFFGDASFGLLWGPLHSKESYSSTGDTTFPAGSREFKRHSYSFQPVTNLGAGIDYKHWFKDMVMIHIATGWEFTWWFDMNQFGRVNPRSNPFTANGNIFFDKPTDLFFQGLTARLGFDF